MLINVDNATWIILLAPKWSTEHWNDVCRHKVIINITELFFCRLDNKAYISSIGAKRCWCTLTTQQAGRQARAFHDCITGITNAMSWTSIPTNPCPAPCSFMVLVPKDVDKRWQHSRLDHRLWNTRAFYCMIAWLISQASRTQWVEHELNPAHLWGGVVTSTLLLASL